MNLDVSQDGTVHVDVPMALVVLPPEGSADQALPTFEISTLGFKVDEVVFKASQNEVPRGLRQVSG